MPRYAPLPRISLDPRTESELVAAAAQRVFEASNATINDFSAGSPIMALLEGQAFAQAEFLQFANEFPEAVLIEWIGPFLGAQRRTGAGSIALLTFEIEPRDQDFIIFEGFESTTDTSRTNGEAINFITIAPLVIPAGQSEGTVEAVSAFVGVNTNVPANSITRTITNLSGVRRVFNQQPAFGGQEVELLSEVKERFFSLIRRRNPVSKEDWVDFFTDALGVGAVVNVLPNRSEREFFQYGKQNPFVSFFLMNPGGIPLTEIQISSLENLIKWALPLQFQGKIYSIEPSNLDFFLEVGYNPDNNYSNDLFSFSRAIRNNLFNLLTPNLVFPPDYQLTTGEISSKLDLTFLQTFGEAFDPTILNIRTYFTPNQLTKTNIFAKALDYSTDAVAKVGDLVKEETQVSTSYYRVLQDFTPQLGSEVYHSNLGDLQLQIIRDLLPRRYRTGEVISDRGNLYVVLSPFQYTGTRPLNQLIDQGLISSEKSFSVFSPGGNYQATDPQGNYDPQIIEFNSSEVNVFEPQIPASIPMERRPGFLVWVVSRNFTRLQDTTTLGTAQANLLVSESEINIRPLQILNRYAMGDYIETPNPNRVASIFPDPFSCYLDPTKGAINLIAEVNQEFTFRLEEGQTFKEVFDSLVTNGIIRVVDIIPFINCSGRGVFSEKPFKYNTRFATGEYVRFRSEGGFDTDQLEKCSRQVDVCPNVESSCRSLLESKLPLPSYFLVAKDFTPNTTDVSSLVEQGFLVPVSQSLFFPSYVVLCPENKDLVSADCITALLLDQNTINSELQLVPGQVAELVDRTGAPLNYYVWDGVKWNKNLKPFPTFRELFRFSPGDVATFRQRGSLFSYEATDYVTPITSIEVYFNAGVFRPTTKSETVKYYDPLYRLEDVCIDNNQFFRVIRPVTPSQGQDPEDLEITNQFQKIVSKSEGTEKVFPRLDLQTSILRLGNVAISLRSKGSNEVAREFVWGRGSKGTISPEKYGKGTIAL